MKSVLCLFIGIVSLSGVQAGVQQQATPYVPRQSDRPEAVTADEPGFQPIFDGKTLAGLGR